MLTIEQGVCQSACNCRGITGQLDATFVGALYFTVGYLALALDIFGLVRMLDALRHHLVICGFDRGSARSNVLVVTRC